MDRREDYHYKQLMAVVGWFFFDLFLLGYVEDPITGLSFSIPGGKGWKIFVEVPSRFSSQSPQQALNQFKEDVPALGLLGVSHVIHPNTPYAVDEDVQLVCKYLQAYELHSQKGGLHGINRLYRENSKSTFLLYFKSTYVHVRTVYVPQNIKNCKKIVHRLLIRRALHFYGLSLELCGKHIAALCQTHTLIC